MATPVIQLIGSTMSTTLPFTDYQWYLNNTYISGATYSEYKPVTNGDYNVFTDKRDMSGTYSFTL